MDSKLLHVHTYMSSWIYIYIYTYIYIYMYIYIYTHIYIYMYIYIYTYIYIYVHMYGIFLCHMCLHECIYTYIYIFTLWSFRILCAGMHTITWYKYTHADLAHILALSMRHGERPVLHAAMIMTTGIMTWITADLRRDAETIGSHPSQKPCEKTKQLVLCWIGDSSQIIHIQSYTYIYIHIYI